MGLLSQTKSSEIWFYCGVPRVPRAMTAITDSAELQSENALACNSAISLVSCGRYYNTAVTLKGRG
jgi:hypothetical protein